MLRKPLTWLRKRLSVQWSRGSGVLQRILVLVMCGRTACSRGRDDVRCACAYRSRGGKTKENPLKPKWLETSSQKYYPSFNISPQSNTPVLLSSKQSHISSLLKSDPSHPEETGDRILQVMKWGLVPNWHKGEASKFPTLLNNCRCEGLMEKPSFRSAVQKKQRCVVLADGFFEWNRKTSHKQPYFIHFTDIAATDEMKEVSMSNDSSSQSEAVTSDKTSDKEHERVIKGRILTMAGLFDVWKGTEMDEPLYTYTIITVDAHPSFAHIHDRMPAILENDDAIERWLDPSIPTHELVPMLLPSTVLSWYPVSTVVNNVKHKSQECVERIDPHKQISKSQNTLLKWFSPSPKKHPPPAACERQKEKREESVDLTQTEDPPPEAKKAKID